MNVFAWLTSRVSSKHRATWLYRRGMMQAKLKKYHAAIADYTTVIDMKGAPAKTRAMARYNRALVYYATANESEAIDDLNQILELSGAAGDIQTEARRKLVRMQRTSNRTDPHESVVKSRSQGGTHARAK